MKNFLCEFDHNQETLMVYCDNQCANHLAKNSTYHSLSKYIDVLYHWIRKSLNDGLLQLEKLHIDNNCFDIITKVILVKKHFATRK